MVKLSLILPVYNVSKFIDRCLNSICCQNNQNIEIIVIDDESPDDSIDKVEKYICLNQINNLRIIHQKNRGLGGARNRGISESKGEYVWFIDSDDEINQGAIPFILNKIDNEDVIIFDFDMIDNNGEHHYGTYNKISCRTHLKGTDIEKNFILTQAWRSIYNRNFLIKENLYFREHFLHEDGEFNMRVMCLAGDVSYYPKLVYHYYTCNNGSIMNTIGIKNIKDLLLHIDTMENMIIKYQNLSNEQKDLLIKHTQASIGVIFSDVLKMDKSIMPEFRKIIKNNRQKIRNVVINKSHPSMWNLVKFYIQLYLPFKPIYRLIYLKHI